MENYFQLNNRFTSETDAADQMLEDVKKKYSDKVEGAFQNAYFKNDIDGARAEEMKESIGNLVNLTPHLYKSFGQGQKDLPIVKQRLGDIQRTVGEKLGDLKQSAGELRENIGQRISTTQTRLGNKNLPDVLDGDPESLAARAGESAVEETEGAIKNIVGRGAQQIQDAAKGAAGKATGAAQKITGKVAGAAEEVSGKVGKLATAAEEGVEGLKSVGTGLLSKAGTTLMGVGAGVSGFETGQNLGLGKAGSSILGTIEGGASLAAPELAPVFLGVDALGNVLHSIFGHHHEETPKLPPPPRITSATRGAVARPISSYK